jgi:hypothetical protein
MKGAEAVITTLGARGPVIADAARAIVTVAEQEGPQRIVMPACAIQPIWRDQWCQLQPRP